MSTYFLRSGVFRMPLLPSLAIFFALLGASIASAIAQSLAAGVDMPVARLCTNQCLQFDQRIAVDDAGNAIAIWTEKDGTRSRIVTARLSAGATRWGMPQRLHYEEGTNTDIGVDGKGNAIAVWSIKRTETQSALRFSRYIALQGTWTRPADAIIHSPYDVRSNLAVARNGNAVIATGGGDFRNGTLAVFDAATGTWQRMQLDDADYIKALRAAIDGSGNAFIAFVYQGYREFIGLNAVRYDAATKRINYGAALDGHFPDYNQSGAANGVGEFVGMALSMDRYGGGMALWQFKLTSPDGKITRTIRSSRYRTATKVWSAKPVPKISNDKIIGEAALSPDLNTHVNAVWTQYIGAYARTVSARFSAWTGLWSTPRVIQSGNYNTREPRIVTDTNGNAFATWSQRSDSGTGTLASAIHRTTAARYSASTGTWGSPRIVQDVNRNAYKNELGIDGKGRAIVLWPQNSSITGVKELRTDRLIPQ